MTQSIRPALLTLALILSGSAALCQQADNKGKPDAGKSQPPVEKITQRVLTDEAGISSYLTVYKHTPNVLILQRAIDVDLSNSTVRQAAEAISKASGVLIQVDSKVPAEDRLKVVTQRIPLGTVLEAIAEQTHLAIEPDEHPSGVLNIVLRTWPVMEVNGTKQILVGRNEPWSDDWDKLPRTVAFPVQDPRGHAPTGNFSPFFSTLPPGGVEPVGRGGMVLPYAGMGNGLTMTALNDHSFVVAEPAFGPNGENGVLLTVYRLDGAQLRSVSTAFHKLAIGGTTGRPKLLPGSKDGNKNPLDKGAPAGTNPFAPAATPNDKGAFDPFNK